MTIEKGLDDNRLIYKNQINFDPLVFCPLSFSLMSITQKALSQLRQFCHISPTQF